MAKNPRRQMPGVSVYPRRKKWAYLVTGQPDIVTGEAARHYEGGFLTEDDAWNRALERKAELEAGRVLRISAITVQKFLTEWLAAVKHSLKPSAFANYKKNAEAYVLPAIGDRRLRDISVPVLNALYVRLLESGRIAGDDNHRMYAYWKERETMRDGLGPGPTEISRACKTSLLAARKAVGRYQRGRIPAAYSPGLAPKSVRNIHRMLHRALKDAVAWQYIALNPAEHASLPRVRRSREARPEPWTLDELARWLKVARDDRFAGMWILAATTGMRRSELAGVLRVNLDLDASTLRIEPTRVVVDGRVEDEDGKSDAGRRIVSLDAFTVAALRQHLAMLDEERQAFGSAYPTHGALLVWPDGSRPHPATITSRFNRLVDLAGARRIRLHDMRHTYSTMSLDSGVEPKILSDRVGHANMNVTFQLYSHRSTGHDRAAAELIGRMIEESLHEPSSG